MKGCYEFVNPIILSDILGVNKVNGSFKFNSLTTFQFFTIKNATL